MIGLLQGTIFYKSENNLIIMVNGVGYKVEVVKSLLDGTEGSEALVYVYTHVREDMIKLFGFSSEKELKTFEMLVSVSGVGPKGALNIISTLGVEGIYAGIFNEDAKAFKAVSGIGTKNAEKIIIELKSKIKKEAAGIAPSRGEQSYTNLQELESALLSLGYSIAEIRNVTPELTYSDNISHMVKQALQLLNRI